MLIFGYPGHVPSTTTSLLTPYFDKNICEFKGPIPLTIFDLGWQALADNYHAEKKVKTDDVKHNNFTGYHTPMISPWITVRGA